MPKTWIEISKKNLLHNVEQFLSLLKPETDFMAVVKSNAYGHGLKEVVQTLAQSEFGQKFHSSPPKADAPRAHKYGSMRRIWFGLDNLDEARVVRGIAPKHPVLVLGYTRNDRLREAAKLGARITIYDWETVRILKVVARDFMSRSGGTPDAPEQSSVRGRQGAALRVHVKVETGTTRQGIGEDEAVEFIKALKKIRGVEVEGISTHFADSEDTRSEYALRQLARYNGIIKSLEGAKIHIPILHMACTAATLRLPRAHGNLVRVGIGMYGLWPSEEIHQAMSLRAERSNLINTVKRSPRSRGSLAMTKFVVDLRPVLTWKTIVAQVKEVKKGTPVSYDLTERVARDSRIAVLPVGYWDGYDRGFSKIGQVLIGGKRCKIVGRVCMNMCMADVTDVRGVKPEDEVVLLGTQGKENMSAEEVGETIDTINYEVVTRINPTLPREVVK